MIELWRRKDYSVQTRWRGNNGFSPAAWGLQCLLRRTFPSQASAGCFYGECRNANRPIGLWLNTGGAFPWLSGQKQRWWWCCVLFHPPSILSFLSWRLMQPFWPLLTDIESVFSGPPAEQIIHCSPLETQPPSYPTSQPPNSGAALPKQWPLTECVC